MITIWTQVTCLDDGTPAIMGSSVTTDKPLIKLNKEQLAALKKSCNDYLDSLIGTNTTIELIQKQKTNG